MNLKEEHKRRQQMFVRAHMRAQADFLEQIARGQAHYAPLIRQSIQRMHQDILAASVDAWRRRYHIVPHANPANSFLAYAF